MEISLKDPLWRAASAKEGGGSSGLSPPHYSTGLRRAHVKPCWHRSEQHIPWAGQRVRATCRMEQERKVVHNTNIYTLCLISDLPYNEKVVVSYIMYFFSLQMRISTTRSAGQKISQAISVMPKICPNPVTVIADLVLALFSSATLWLCTPSPPDWFALKAGQYKYSQVTLCLPFLEAPSAFSVS